MKVMVLKIKKKAPLVEIEKLLKTTFRSEEYMYGYLDGYLFDYYIIETLDKFEARLNTLYDNNKYYIKFIQIEE